MRHLSSRHKENKYLAVQLLDRNVKSILERINTYSPSVGMHCIYTAIYASAIAEKLGYKPDMIHQITAGCLIHDLGKISVPSEILNKTCMLTNNEFELVKYHPQFGHIQVEPLFGKVANDIVLLHHEKIDGTGYPFGLKDIPEYVQIATVSDIFDALTSERCYKKTLTPEKAVEELKKEMDKGKLSKRIVNVIKDGWLHDDALSIINITGVQKENRFFL